MNKTDLQTYVDGLRHNIEVASNGSMDEKRVAERSMLNYGVALAIGFGEAFLDIRDSLKRVADAHDTLANYGLAVNSPQGQRVTEC